MKYQIDHDLHIHSQISLCSKDPEQTTARILQYAKDSGLRQICLTDHYWDDTQPGASTWYQKQPFAHIAQALPLPKDDDVEFLFGCETDMDKFFTIGIPPQRFEDFAFVIIPTTHLHMTGFTISEEWADSHEKRAELWVKRLDALLDMPLPFHKVGIAHLACGMIFRRSREDYLRVLELLPSAELERLFSKAAKLGCGIELNQSDMSFADEEADRVLRMFRVAKSCGCKFYLGSDAHHPENFAKTKAIFERAVALLELQESDKFHLQK